MAGIRGQSKFYITVEPQANPRDTRPPRTRYWQTGTTVRGLPGYRITLRPSETASVYFWVTGVGTLSFGIPTAD